MGEKSRRNFSAPIEFDKHGNVRKAKPKPKKPVDKPKDKK